VNPNSATWTLDGPLEVIANTAGTRTGGADPTGFVRDGRVWRAAYYPTGPATLAVWTLGDAVHAQAWGPGADAALAGVPNLIGLADDARGFDSTRHPLVHDVARRRPGVRLVRTENLFDAAVRAVLGQKVTGLQAKRSYQAVARQAGVPAPLPRVRRRPLLLPPTPEAVLRALAGHGATALGIDTTRAATLREVALLAAHLDTVGSVAPADAGGVRNWLEEIPGVGAWTANEVTLTALGDPDAVSIGDYHLKNYVEFALTGAARGTDERMVELLEPFRPHRARAVRFIELSGVRPPRYGPRMSIPTHIPGPPGFTDPTPLRGAAGRSQRSRSRPRAR
jgi:3-methyladenine DNA glycosylase/8-oxoguanine DNA glycosylase